MKNERKKKKIKERRAAGRCALSSWHPPARPGPAGLSRQKPAGRERERSETQTHPCPGCGPPGFPPPKHWSPVWGRGTSAGLRSIARGRGHRVGPIWFWKPPGLEPGDRGEVGTRGGTEALGGHSAVPLRSPGIFFFPLDEVVSSGAAGDQLGPFPHGSDCCVKLQFGIFSRFYSITLKK